MMNLRESLKYVDKLARCNRLSAVDHGESFFDNKSYTADHLVPCLNSLSEIKVQIQSVNLEGYYPPRRLVLSTYTAYTDLQDRSTADIWLERGS